MKNHSVRYWVPRGLAVLYILFISLFTFDAWEGTSSFWEGLVGWFIHLLPVIIVVLALIIAWRRPLLGGLIFLFLAVAFAVFFAQDGPVDWAEAALATGLIAGPLAVVGVLFLLEHRRSPAHPTLQA